MTQDPNHSKLSSVNNGPSSLGTLKFRLIPKDSSGPIATSQDSSLGIQPLKKLAIGACLLGKGNQARKDVYINGLDLITLHSARTAIDQISALSSYFVNHPIDGFMLSPDGNPDSTYADVARENLMSAEARIRELEVAQSVIKNVFNSLYDIFDGALIESSDKFCKYESPFSGENQLAKAHRFSVKSIQRLLG